MAVKWNFANDFKQKSVQIVDKNFLGQNICKQTFKISDSFSLDKNFFQGWKRKYLKGAQAAKRPLQNAGIDFESAAP